MNYGKMNVVDVRKKGTILEIWLSKESDEDFTLVLEISFNWRRSDRYNDEFDPVFQSAFIHHPGTDEVNYTSLSEKQVNDLVSDWEVYVTK